MSIDLFIICYKNKKKRILSHQKCSILKEIMEITPNPLKKTLNLEENEKFSITLRL